MKNKFIYLYLLLMGLPLAAQAQNSTLNKLKIFGGIYGYGTNEKPADLKTIIINLVQLILGFVGYIFIILIIIAGVQWMLSGGNEEKITKAKNLLKNSVIGLVLMLIAFAIATTINWILVSSLGQTGGPTSSP